MNSKAYNHVVIVLGGVVSKIERETITNFLQLAQDQLTREYPNGYNSAEDWLATGELALSLYLKNYKKNSRVFQIIRAKENEAK